MRVTPTILSKSWDNPSVYVAPEQDVDVCSVHMSHTDLQKKQIRQKAFLGIDNSSEYGEALPLKCLPCLKKEPLLSNSLCSCFLYAQNWLNQCRSDESCLFFKLLNTPEYNEVQ